LTLPEKEMRKLRGNKISMVFQEPLASLNPVFRVGEQIAEVLRVHLQPLTGSPAVSYFMISAIALMICGVFFTAVADQHPVPGVGRWRLNLRPSTPYVPLQRYVDPFPKARQCAHHRHGQV
jgi:ABC-type dipeptide/oligopeptide/nickel transport system ATPase component